MKLPSFRLRVALLSAALAGSALIGFGAIFWFQIYNAQIGKLDAELFSQKIDEVLAPALLHATAA
jgi:two-component system, OmpR family, heavy metal sensor histidine kinase CusS